MLLTSLFDGPCLTSCIEAEHYRIGLKEPNDFLASPRAISQRTEVYVRRLRKYLDGDLGAVEIVSTTYGGYCVYAIEHYGISFTRLARLSIPAVADVVAAISGDPRLDLGKRRQHQCAAVAVAGVLPQLVVLAELVTLSQSLLKIAGPEWLRLSSGFGCANHYELQTWCEHAYNLLQRMQQLFQRQRFTDSKDLLERRLRELHARTRVRKLPRNSRAKFVEEKGVFLSLVPAGHDLPTGAEGLQIGGES